MDSNNYIPDNLILGTLSFTDLENIEKKIDPESIKRFLKLKEQYQVRKTAHESCEINEQIYDSMADTNPDLQPIANKAKSLTGNLKDELDSIETEIRELTNIGKNVEFKEPKYGTKSTYKSSISSILPTIEVNSKRKIWNVWNRIADIIEENELNESAGRDLFGSCLKCPNMIDYFELFSSNNLNGRQIAIKLSQMYDTRSNKATYLSQYNSFKRSNTETVENAIERLKTILTGIEQHKRPGERKTDPEIYLRHHIKKMVSHKVWEQVEKEEAENLRDGRPMSINQIANRLDAIEERILEKAMPDSMIQINSINRPNQNIENYNKPLTQNQFQPIYKPDPNNQNHLQMDHYNPQKQFYHTPIPRLYPQKRFSFTPTPKQPIYGSYPQRPIYIKPFNQNTQRGIFMRPFRGGFNTYKGYYFKPFINSAVKESAEGRPPTPYPSQESENSQDSNWEYQNKKRTSNNERNPKRFQTKFIDSEQSTQIGNQKNQPNTSNAWSNGKPGQPFTHQNQQSHKQKDDIWDDDPKQSHWEKEIAKSDFGRGGFKIEQNNDYRDQHRGYRGQFRGFRGQGNFRGQNGGFRGQNTGYRGHNSGFRGRPFVKYVSRQQILYDQTCQNADCQVPGQFVHHQDDCPKANNRDNKDFQ